ncbi:10145_t:CDS:2 [Entrophospora sp. SA101]|nr:10145_t:CDS:2 [Entrophospora sp. SA101]
MRQQQLYVLAISVPPCLSYFCIYNPTLGPTEETQKDQILYYTSRKQVPLDTTIRQIGLAQGIVNFTKIFSPTKPCENVHTQKNRLAFYEAEPNYWIHLIELGYVRRTTKDKDGKPKIITEYLDVNLHDSEIGKMLEIGYEMYRASILYLPLSRPAYLEITSLIEQIHSEYEIIEDAVVLWKNKLIYNGSIPENQLKGIWKHLDTLISERNLFERELERKKNTKDSDKQDFLTFAFLIPAKSVEGITKVYDMKFYISLDECLSIRSESIINAVNEDYEKSRKFGGLTITNEMAHALCDIHEDLEKHQQLTEVYTRSTTNFWVVGRRSDKRILYIVVPKKDTSLIEVEDEIRKLTSLYFSANNN